MMPTLEEFLQAINYKITDGQTFGWDCYGSNAYIISSEGFGEFSSTIIFDNKTQEVYEVEVHDYLKNKSYRLISSQYLEKNKAEAIKRGVDFKQAYDEVQFIDLEVKEDILEKLTAINNGEEYDERILVPVDLTDEELAILSEQALDCGLSVEDYMSKIVTDNLEKIINDSTISNNTPVSNLISQSFDLEQHIQSCWTLVDDLRFLTEGVLDKELTKDQISNVLLGLTQLYQLKFEKLFENFEKIHADICKTK